MNEIYEKMIDSERPENNFERHWKSRPVHNPTLIVEKKDHSLLVTAVVMGLFLTISTGLLCYVKTTQSAIRGSNQEVGIIESDGSGRNDEIASPDRSSQGGEFPQVSDWDVTVVDSSSGTSERYHVRYELAPANDERYTTRDEIIEDESRGESPVPSVAR